MVWQSFILRNVPALATVTMAISQFPLKLAKDLIMSDGSLNEYSSYCF
jgi:hypothetical protein